MESICSQKIAKPRGDFMTLHDDGVELFGEKKKEREAGLHTSDLSNGMKAVHPQQLGRTMEDVALIDDNVTELYELRDTLHSAPASDIACEKGLDAGDTDQKKPDDGEEEKKGCALETSTRLTDSEFFRVRFTQFSNVVAFFLFIYQIVYSASRREFGIMIAYIGVALVHATIRSLMDWKYDTMMLTGRAKRKEQVKLAMLNYAQLRISYEAQRCVSEGAVGMGIKMTKMVEALLKKVPLAVFSLIDAFSLMGSSTGDVVQLVTIFLLLFNSFLLSVFQTSQEVAGFEFSMNPRRTRSSSTQLTIMVFFFCDAYVRAASVGILMFTMITRGGFYSWLASLVLFILYGRVVALLASVYISRGYIYEPIPPDTHDTSTACQKVLFSLFPAGFVQVFAASFPFNGDLASKKMSFIVHQCCLVLESVAGVLIALVGFNLPELLWEPWVAYIFLIVWGLVQLLQIATFVIYYEVRLGTAGHTSKMAGSTSLDSADGEIDSEHSKLLEDNHVVAYVKNNCPECNRMLALLAENQTRPLIRNISELQPEIEQRTLKLLKGISDKLPVIFIDGKSVAGMPDIDISRRLHKKAPANFRITYTQSCDAGSQERDVAIDLIRIVFPHAEVEIACVAGAEEVVIYTNEESHKQKVVSVPQQDLYRTRDWPGKPKIIAALRDLKENFKEMTASKVEVAA